MISLALVVVAALSLCNAAPIPLDHGNAAPITRHQKTAAPVSRRQSPPIGGDTPDTTPFRLKVITNGTCDNRFVDMSHIGAAESAAVVIDANMDGEGTVFNFTGPIGETSINAAGGIEVPYTFGYGNTTSPYNLVEISSIYDTMGWYFDEEGILQLARDDNPDFYTCPELQYDDYTVENPIFVKAPGDYTPDGCTDIQLGRAVPCVACTPDGT